ncbi:MAG: alpha-N-arabinofuranosidase [Planctomycetota bacterium]|nr:alpha-N-arabinofuranosidase [Planctomycetota bacterium]
MDTKLHTHVHRAGNQVHVKVEAAQPAPIPIKPFLLGKFCEHLGSNIYHGMEAQILRNPTFARYRFGAGESNIDGGVVWEYDEKKIAERIRAHAQRMSWPDAAPVIEAHLDGLAFPWQREGAKEDVLVSPDVGPHGGRAQRIETRKTGAGVAQHTYLPLHRTQKFPYRVVARAFAPVAATLTLAAMKDGVPGEVLAQTVLSLSPAWQTYSGVFELPASADPGGLFRVSFTTAAPANVVLGRVLLYPGDHVNGADPEIIQHLKDAKLPILRWPGGNFVSGYDWRDGVGPVDARPTRPNPAWEGLEYNFFGTAEFIAYCRAIGCEPLICVNGGDGTPEDAAAWIQYCNGSPETPMGRLRAGHGHPEPFRVKYWEVGNELYGRWQVNWTTPGGNADRYVRFAQAMKAADPSILLLGCGEPTGIEKEWNRDLIAAGGANLRCITDHLLNGGPVDAKTDPVELYHAFMGFPRVLAGAYRTLREKMEAGGCVNPRLAITELQLFARFRGEADPQAALRPETMPAPSTISEAVYFAAMLFEFVRLNGFVEMFTHSATVNHGGGLRKSRERVWADPVHYAHVMSVPLANARPLPVQVACDTVSTKKTYGTIPPHASVPVADALAARAADGSLVLLLAHLGAACGPLEAEVELAGAAASGDAEVLTLSGETMYAANRFDRKEAVTPRSSRARIEGGRLKLTLPAFSLTRVVVR